MWRPARLRWLTHWLLQPAIPAIKAKLLCRSLLLLPAGLLLLLATGRAAAQTGPQVVHLAKLEIYPEQLASYQAALKEHIETALRIEPGVLTLYPVADAAQPTHITVLEIYASPAAHQAHLQAPHFLSVYWYAARPFHGIIFKGMVKNPIRYGQ
jgi:quinol monooxygenase YgiN